ncbi:MAG: hypothetical protein TU35_002780 [Thermoproteus sp. AZ2]|uniref:Uncharacterized protein n=1 Tax=Thermoproteus sp. AZ2 TaxID=1609232 RepID=A0ACC6UZD4_9CREN
MIDEVFIGLIGVIVTVVAYAASMAYWLGGKFKEIEYRFREVERRFEEVDKRFNDIEEELRGIRAELRRALEDFATTTRNSQEFLVEILTYEGALRSEAASVIKGEVSRLFNALSARIRGNPLSREEIEEIKKYIEKDELTLEEAYRFKELAWKLVEEYREEFPDVWKIYWYAVAWVGWAARLKRERSKEGRA